MVSHKVGLTASILDKVKVEFNLSADKLVSLNDWTSWALGRMYNECDLYRSAIGTPQAGDAYKRYTDELDKLDKWVEDMAEVLRKWGALVQNSNPKADSNAAGGKEKDGKDKSASDDKDASLNKNTGADPAKRKQAKDAIESTINKHVSDKEKNAHPTQLKPISIDENKSAAELLADLQPLVQKTPLDFA